MSGLQLLTKTIKLGGFHFAPDGLKVVGKPPFGDFESALAFAHYMEVSSPFWKADLFAYAKTREDWSELVDQVIDAGTFTKRSVDQYRYVSKNVPPEDRVEGLSFSHHEAVAALPSGDKRSFLNRAKREHLSVAELKQAVRKVRRRKVLKVVAGQASELAALFGTVKDLASDAAQACKNIPHDDAKKGLEYVSEARNLLDECEAAVQALWKAQGRRR